MASKGMNEFGQVQWGSGAVGWKAVVGHSRVRNAGVGGEVSIGGG